MPIDVIMIDDRKETLEIAEKMLTRINPGIRMSLFESCEDALEKLDEGSPDAIICDYDMGPNKITGLDMLEKIRSDGKQTPFIMFTGRSREDIAVDALNLGADYYLLKKLGNVKALYEQLAHYVATTVSKHKLEMKLKRSEVRFSRLFEHASVGMTISDSHEEVVRVNQAMADMLGYTIEELNLMKVSDFSHSEDYELERSKYLDCLRHGKKSYRMNKRYITKKGETVWGRLACTILTDRATKENTIVKMVEDITEKLRAEAELARKNADYQQLLENVADMVLSIDKDGNIVTCANKPNVFSTDEISGEKLWRLVDDDCTAKVNSAISEVISSARNQQLTVRYTPENGTSIWWETSFAPIIEDGKIAYIAVVARDITERYIGRRDLRESEKRLKIMFEQSAIGIAQVSLEGTIIEPNQKLCEILGYEREELRGMSVFDIGVDEDSDREKDLSRKLQEGRIKSYQMTKRFIRKDNEVIHGRLTVSLLRTPNGKPAFTIGFLEDVSSEINAKIMLRESEARFRATFEQSSIGMTMVELDDNIIKVNDAYCDMLGYSHDELEKMKVAEYTHPDDVDKDKANLEKMLKEDGSSFRMNKRYYRKDGTMIWVDLTVSLLRDDDGNPSYVIGIANEITERKRAEKELRRSRENFRKIFHHSPIGIQILNSEGKIVQINDTARDIFGVCDAQELIGFDILNDPNTAIEVKHAIRNRERIEFEDQFDFGLVKEKELYNTSKSGYVYLETIIEPIFSDKDEAKKLIVLINDVSEKVEARKELAKREQWFRELFENSPVAINVFDKNGTIIDANRACLDMFGVENLEDLKEFNIFEDPNLPPEVKHAFDHGEAKRIETKFDFELIREAGLYPTKREGVIVLDSVNSPLYSEGKLAGYIIQMLDITKEVNATKALKEREEELRAIFEESPIGIEVFDSNGRLVRANKAAKALFGFSSVREQQRHNFFEDTFVPENAKERLERGKSAAYVTEIDMHDPMFSEATYAGKKGKVIIDVTLVPIALSGKLSESNMVLALIQNITEEATANELLRSQKEQLSEFAHAMSHDIRNYLHRINGYVELWRMEDDPSYEQKIAGVVDSLDQLLKHSVQLADAGLVIEERKEVDMNDVVDSVADLTLPSTTVIRRDELSPVIGDETKIRQVFANLFGNAVKHGKATSIEVREESHFNTTLFNIINDGEPIDDHLTEGLFEQKTGHPEHGFGLQIVARIIQAHNWEIRLANNNPVTIQIKMPKESQK